MSVSERIHATHMLFVRILTAPSLVNAKLDTQELDLVVQSAKVTLVALEIV